MLRILVGECHVGESYRAVLRYVVQHLKGGKRAWLAFDHEKRRAVWNEIREIHDYNRDVYRSVMSGQF